MVHIHANETTPLVTASLRSVEVSEGRVALDDGTIPGQKQQHSDDDEAIELIYNNTSSMNDPQQIDNNRWNWNRFFRILGPGIMVCLADTDGPCLLTAAQSGAQYKYSLVLCQMVLIPILYAAQELTVRLAVCTKEGTTALIREQYGHGWAWFAVTLHVFMCWIGQASEFGAIGMLFQDAFGIHRNVTNTVQVVLLMGIVVMGRLGYRFTEVVGVAFGSLQLVFVALLFLSQAKPVEIWNGLTEFHFQEDNYEILLAGNIGAVIMPWMLYYHQSAVCERRIQRRDLKYERADTWIGAVLAQLVMTAMVVAMGSLRFYGSNDDPRTDGLGFREIIQAYAQAFTGTTFDDIQPGATSILDVQPALPDDYCSSRPDTTYCDADEVYAQYAAEMETWYTPAAYTAAKWVVVLGVCGACTVASMVLTITSVWSVTEILNIDRDLFHPIAERPLQYALQFGGLWIAYGLSIFTDISGPWFAVLTQTINGLLILPVAAFLWLLASSPKVLPREYRLAGWYKWLLAFVFAVICGYCIYGMVQEIL
eukprot:CAMPEP_0194204212 /NCGR_PEP_ID=MMETSP0156-20130528/3804_1 /TAXON_ID=33649 /ORGANISM="Thalassionema nitzschioides, Strain L26-B" /LENGTH=536 /DNA_ID=CAMNT_0038930173 /DNA_START=73 /DNA_END=1679 /DNA_ORIENTATION=-